MEKKNLWPEYKHKKNKSRMLTSYRRPTRAMVRRAGTPVLGYGVARTARTLVAAAKKLAPYARAAGAKSSLVRKLGPVRVKSTPRVRYGGAARGLSFNTPGNDLSTSRARVGRKKKPTVVRLQRLMKSAMNNQVFRFQNISNYDTNVGALSLMQYFNSTTSGSGVPLHIYDLTTFPNTSSTVAPGRSYQWTTAAATADITRIAIPGQNPDGSADADGYWHVTNRAGQQVGSPSETLPNASVMQHNWTSVGLNLYGPRKRTTKFVVTFFRCTLDSANPFHAATSNTDLKQLVEVFVRPMIYSNLQTYQSKVRKYIKVVKRFTYYVPGGETTDVDTTVGKIKEVKIFLRHDRNYRLDHQGAGEAGLPHAMADGIDYVEDLSKENHPWPSSRLFMAITAFHPEKPTVAVTAGTYGPTGAQIGALADPSYDIIIQNSITTP